MYRLAARFVHVSPFVDETVLESPEVSGEAVPPQETTWLFPLAIVGRAPGLKREYPLRALGKYVAPYMDPYVTGEYAVPDKTWNLMVFPFERTAIPVNDVPTPPFCVPAELVFEPASKELAKTVCVVGEFKLMIELAVATLYAALNFNIPMTFGAPVYVM
jgi:hypothetical protein